ncbi:MAG: ribonuclease T [Succinivibrio sp.]|jgi:ribonuclease T|nr:ribonuclease T [Succinivibrio sp.]
MEDISNKLTIKDRFRGFLPVVVDVETAGLDPKKSALIEVAMMTVKIDEKGQFVPDEIYSANIRPFEGSEICQKNIDFLHIDPFDESRNLVTESDALLPMFKAIKKKLKEQGCKRAILVGHNAHFDHSFIFAAIDRLKVASKSPFHPFSVIDTASLSMLVLGQSVLQKACYAAKVDFDQNCAHGAAYDTLKETELFCAILNRFTKFCGMPEPVDIEIDYNNSKSKESSESSANNQDAKSDSSDNSGN